VLLVAFLSGGAAGTPGAVALAQAPGTYDVQGAYVAAAQAAPCHPDPRDLAAIQSVETPSAMVDPSGHVSNPDGSPVRGDGGDSFGAFQFNERAGTWAVYGNGGDVDNLADSARATAEMLCADNYSSDRHAAIAAHNGSGPAARAYADRVIAAADGAQPFTAAPLAASSADDCATSGGRKPGDVVDRAWACLVVKPWLLLGKKHPSPAWSKVDRVVFGDGPQSAPNVQAAGSHPASVAGFTCPVVTGVEVGDGWGAPRSGHEHQGVDVFGAADSPMVAPFDGTVSEVVTDEAAGGLGGMAVTVKRADGTEVYLAHANRVDVHGGQQVKAGQQVGLVGNSGNARGGATHVHVQYYPSGSASPVPAGPTIGAACGKNTDPGDS
jgi:murein DD-endopeptidase MepM/ murein hydrolase activator NlpD